MKTFITAFVLFFLLVGSAFWMQASYPKKPIQMYVSDTYSIMRHGTFKIRSEYCALDDPFKCIVRFEERMEPKYKLHTRFTMNLSELSFPSQAKDIMNLLFILLSFDVAVLVLSFCIVIIPVSTRGYDLEDS